MSDIKKGTLGEILSASRIISAEDVSAALDEQKRSGVRFGEALINLGIVTQEDIDWALSNQLDLPYIRLKKEMIDPDAISLITSAMARSYNCIPLIKAGGELNIAIADPLNKTAIETIERHTGCSVSISVALIREIREMIDTFYGVDPGDSIGFRSSIFSASIMEIINSDTTAEKLLHYLLVFIQQNRVNTLLLQPVEGNILVRAKRSGKTHTIGTIALNHYPELVHRIRKRSEMVSSGAFSQTGLLNFNSQNTNLLLQVSSIAGEGGEYITITHCKTCTIPHSFSELNRSQVERDTFLKLSSAERGITVVASNNQEERGRIIDLMLEERDTASQNVLILGKNSGFMNKKFPRIPLPESERDLAQLIRDLLDHAPDLLVIDDITDPLPFAAACRLAMRGVAIIGGFDQGSLQETLRQLHIYTQKQLVLPIFINGVIAFKSIQTLCPECRTEFTPPAEELAIIGGEPADLTFYRSFGCSVCNGSGIAERRILLDLLPFDDNFINAFENAAEVSAIEAYLKDSSYLGSKNEGLALLQNGLVSPDEYIASIIL